MKKEKNKIAELNKIIERLRINIKKALFKNKTEKALEIMRVLAKLLYFLNQEYKDDNLESELNHVVENLFGSVTEQIKGTDSDYNENKVIFYDGFGLNSRGLALIYLKALLQRRYVIYVVDKRRETFIPDIIKLLQEHQAKIVYLHGRSAIDDCYELKQIIEENRPGHLFLYTTPWDISGISVFNYYNDKRVTRYQINLTDHAFWLGVNAFDYCIEFRDYGAYISNEFRGIRIDKLRLLPYYPIIDYNKEFEGIPFEFDSSRQKLIFSGGSLYKTLGADNLYYQFVRHMLNTHPEVVFWYAGEGDDSQLRLLMHDYPRRVHHTKERKDLYQVLLHSYMYLNTYPMVGGLMFQYAAIAGKVPLTLKYDDCANDCLIGQSQLGVEFDALDAFYDEMERLLSDPEYASKKGEALKSAVISQREFEDELEKIMRGEHTKFPIALKQIDTSGFQKTYIERLTLKDLHEIMIDRRSVKYMVRIFPRITIAGIMKKIMNKLCGR